LKVNDFNGLTAIGKGSKPFIYERWNAQGEKARA